MGGGGQPGEGRQGGGFGGGGGFGNMAPEERQRRFQERMASMSPEEREQFMQRMRDRGMDPANPGGGFMGGRPGSGPPAAGGGSRTSAASGDPAASRPVNRPSAQTIDQLFGPLPVTESAGRAWLYINKELKSVRLRLGITDGTHTELLVGELQTGQELVTSVVTPAQAAAATTRSPLMPGGPGMGGRPGGGMPGGGMPGGGGGQRR